MYEYVCVYMHTSHMHSYIHILECVLVAFCHVYIKTLEILINSFEKVPPPPPCTVAFIVRLKRSTHLSHHFNQRHVFIVFNMSDKFITINCSNSSTVLTLGTTAAFCLISLFRCGYPRNIPAVHVVLNDE